MLNKMFISLLIIVLIEVGYLFLFPTLNKNNSIKNTITGIPPSVITSTPTVAIPSRVNSKDEQLKNELTNFIKTTLRNEYAISLPSLNLTKTLKKDKSGNDFVEYADNKIMIKGLRFETQLGARLNGDILYQEFYLSLINNKENSLNAIKKAYSNIFNLPNVPDSRWTHKPKGEVNAYEMLQDNPDGSRTGWVIFSISGVNPSSYTYKFAIGQDYPIDTDNFSRGSVISHY